MRSYKRATYPTLPHYLPYYKISYFLFCLLSQKCSYGYRLQPNSLVCAVVVVAAAASKTICSVKGGIIKVI